MLCKKGWDSIVIRWMKNWFKSLTSFEICHNWVVIRGPICCIRLHHFYSACPFTKLFWGKDIVNSAGTFHTRMICRIQCTWMCPSWLSISLREAVLWVNKVSLSELICDFETALKLRQCDWRIRVRAADRIEITHNNLVIALMNMRKNLRKFG